ncbi:MAG TPA: twin-arginine translocase TatA/TatE family subunit [Candidatus Acidoferrales bacterium]|nr:twin-arginine translocase TatA/TatE family subunit [Candidatus Acidoferrales bacterium]
MLSIPHLIILFVIALVFFGPEKLPELARNLGKVMAEFKRATSDFRSTLEDQMRELERETTDRKIGGGIPSRPAPASPNVGSSQLPEKTADTPSPINPPASNEQGNPPQPIPGAAGSVTAEPPYLARTAADSASVPQKKETATESSDSSQKNSQSSSDDGNHLS